MTNIGKFTPDTNDKQADALIALEQVKQQRREGILLDNDTLYSHTSSNGGSLTGLLPRRIKSGNALRGLLIFIALIVIIELLDYVF